MTDTSWAVQPRGSAVRLSRSSRSDDSPRINLVEIRDGVEQAGIRLSPHEFDAVGAFVGRLLRDVAALASGALARWPDRQEHIGVIPRWNGRQLSAHLVRSESGAGLLRLSTRVEFVHQVHLAPADAQRLLRMMEAMTARLATAGVAVAPQAVVQVRRHVEDNDEEELFSTARRWGTLLRFSRTTWQNGSVTISIREFLNGQATAQGLNLNRHEFDSVLARIDEFQGLLVADARGAVIGSNFDLGVIRRSNGRTLECETRRGRSDETFSLVFTVRSIDRAYGVRLDPTEAGRLRDAIIIFKDRDRLGRETS